MPKQLHVHYEIKVKDKWEHYKSALFVGDNKMPYVYEAEKPKLFTEQNQRMFLNIRDNVNRLLKEAGAVRLSEAISCEIGEVWELVACVDRMVELKEIRCIYDKGAMQDNVYVSNRRQ